jgi:hypothetical protein
MWSRSDSSDLIFRCLRWLKFNAIFYFLLLLTAVVVLIFVLLCEHVAAVFVVLHTLLMSARLENVHGPTATVSNGTIHLNSNIYIFTTIAT